MRLLAWFFGLMAVILGIWFVWGGGFEERFTLRGSVEYLETAGSFAWLLGWGLLVADILLPIPGTVVMSALGWVYGPVLGGLLAGTGSMLSGLAAYGLCRLLGQRTARFLLGDRDYVRGHDLFEKGGGWVVCLSRALPILPEAVACTAGLVRMPFGRFFLALACGSLPMGFVFGWVGAAGHDEPAMAIGLSLLLPVVLWVLSRLLSRRLERKVESEHE
ncbi:hypothetical protein HAHE_11470 [Haloferula helveola]|uniref:VTT domain-containing protein n=1 Tax=Haloferula helveola TaxID=490095 RepID=A0ABN6H107_9BACT|nr:hypothetical protein HAHE_11470 [Haloferula helveola]